MKRIISTLVAVSLLLTMIPIHSFASQNENLQTKVIGEDSFQSDFLNFEDMQDTLTYEEALAIYQKKIEENPVNTSTQIRPSNIFRLIFSLAKNGANYIVKVTSKGKTIKSVRNGKLEVDVSRHINAKNRFGTYGSIDKLVKYIVEDIRRMDTAGLAKHGDNTIRTLYGKDKKLLEIRFHVKNGELLNFNAFPNHSNRDLGNVIWLLPQ